MSMKTSLITHLNAQSGLTDLVGSRIRITYAEQDDALPYVVLSQISNVPIHHMTAASTKTQGRFQFDSYGATTLSAESVAEQLRQALDGFRGTMGSDVSVSTCHLELERDSDSPPIEGAHTGIALIQQDYLIAWTVSVPTSS